MLANTYFQKIFERCSRDNIEEGVQGKLSRSTTNLIPAYRRVGLVLCEKNRSWKYDNQYSPKQVVAKAEIHSSGKFGSSEPGARSREPDVLRLCREQRVGARTEHVRSTCGARTEHVRSTLGKTSKCCIFEIKIRRLQFRILK